MEAIPRPWPPSLPLPMMMMKLMNILLWLASYIAQANEPNECASTKDTKMSGNDNTSSHYQVVWCTYVIYTHSYNCNQY